MLRPVVPVCRARFGRSVDDGRGFQPAKRFAGPTPLVSLRRRCHARGQGFVAALAGVAGGSVVAWYLSDLVSGLLYGVRAQDPLTFATVPALLLVVALIACWIPAGRATLVGPATALRHD